ncbi:hypothetical protein E2562_039059 [Oryza meyeriana var. granulata]|uniref:Uncharacterized protein n=1 Tax=Oryza meyeriana var. granulata TaxID=110450 RepID=A0A6G1EUG9_9ORYZ|nr:hypothetical protein E2562_039059 [Oryza meyeriana var. granulata]
MTAVVVAVTKEVAVTNIGKGWWPWWFAIRGVVLAYSKIRCRVATGPALEATTYVRLIRVPRNGGGRVGDQHIGFFLLKNTITQNLIMLSNKRQEPSCHRCCCLGQLLPCLPSRSHAT